MSDLEVKCTRCGAVLSHICVGDDDFFSLRNVAQRLYEYCPEGLPTGFTKMYGYQKGDENAPFFSEAFLYTLMGKEDARTILAMIHNIIKAAGLDPDEIEHKAGEKLRIQEEERHRQEEHRKKRKQTKKE